MGNLAGRERGRGTGSLAQGDSAEADIGWVSRERNVSEIIISRMVLYLQENVIVCVMSKS